jgi:hypothetical protein
MTRLFVLLLLGGCAPGSWKDFRAAVGVVACDRAVRCGQVGASERAKCTLDMAVQISPSLFDVQAALDAGLIRYVPDGAQACIDAIKDSGCSDEPIRLGCHNVLQPATTIGARCWASDQCEGGACVQPTAGCPGTCVGYPPVGAPCVPTGGDATNTCDPTIHYCGPDGTCTLRHPPGDPCGSDGECSFGWFCVDGKCGDKQFKAGDPCPDGDCGAKLYCDASGACQELLGPAQPCTVLSSCAPGLVCVHSACTAWLDSGSPCDVTTPPTGCPASQACDGGVCAAITPDNVSGFAASCSSVVTCAPGYVCDELDAFCHDLSGQGGRCNTDGSGCMTGLSCENHVCVAVSAAVCQ